MSHSTTTSKEWTKEPEAIVAGLRAAMVDAADPEMCAGLLGDVKRVRGWLDAFEARVSKRLRELHLAGSGATVADEHARCGGVSSGEGRLVSGTVRASSST